MTTQGGSDVPKNESEFSQTNLELIAKNYRALNYLYYGFSLDEFIKIKSCKSAKEIWDKGL